MTARTTPLTEPADMAQALSAWMDGEALPDGVDQAQLLSWAASADAGRLAWCDWHLAGDVLRQSHADELVDASLPATSVAWMGSLQQALAQTHVASMQEDVLSEVHGEGDATGQVLPQAPAGLQPAPQRVDQFDTQRDAANDGLWRWKMAAGFASVAAVALLGWNVLTLQPQAGSMALMAQQSPATVPQEQQSPAAAPAGQTALVMADFGALPEPQLEEMLAAHAQVGGQSLLPELTMASLDTR